MGWLFEWAADGSTLPALLAALWICEPRWHARLGGWIAILLRESPRNRRAGRALSHGHNGAVGAAELIWTGKAVEVGWSGFSWRQARQHARRHRSPIPGNGCHHAATMPGGDIGASSGCRDRCRCGAAI